jgi:hypothetical protein
MNTYEFAIKTVTITTYPVNYKGEPVLSNEAPSGGGWKAKLSDESGRSLARIRPPKHASFFDTEEEAYEKAESAMHSLFENPVLM